MLLSEMVILIAPVLSGLEDTNSGSGSWWCRALVVVELVVVYTGGVTLVLHWCSVKLV